MLKDHLGNIRMLLTEETKQDVYPAATLEGNLNTSTDAAYIEKNYYAIDPTYVVNTSAAPNITTIYNNNGTLLPIAIGTTTIQTVILLPLAPNFTK